MESRLGKIQPSLTGKRGVLDSGHLATRRLAGDCRLSTPRSLVPRRDTSRAWPEGLASAGHRTCSAGSAWPHRSRRRTGRGEVRSVPRRADAARRPPARALRRTATALIAASASENRPIRERVSATLSAAKVSFLVRPADLLASRTCRIGGQRIWIAARSRQRRRQILSRNDLLLGISSGARLGERRRELADGVAILRLQDVDLATQHVGKRERPRLLDLFVGTGAPPGSPRPRVTRSGVRTNTVARARRALALYSSCRCASAIVSARSKSSWALEN